MAKARKTRVKVVPIVEEEENFPEFFETFIEDIQQVHGADAARCYRVLREREAASARARGIDYPSSSEQLQDFLAYHTAK